MLEKITRKEFYSKLDSFLLNNTVGSWYWIYDKTAVNYGYSKDCNIDWCIEHGIEANDSKRCGGCIVSAPGNINLVDLRKFDGRTWLAGDILRAFTEFLSTKGLNSKYDHNDVMVDGYKVASGVSFNIRPEYKMQYTGLQFSVSQDYEVLRNVCLKKSRKQPRGLSEFGVTTKDIEDWIKTEFK